MINVYMFAIFTGLIIGVPFLVAALKEDPKPLFISLVGVVLFAFGVYTELQGPESKTSLIKAEGHTIVRKYRPAFTSLYIYYPESETLRVEKN